MAARAQPRVPQPLPAVHSLPPSPPPSPPGPGPRRHRYVQCMYVGVCVCMYVKEYMCTSTAMYFYHAKYIRSRRGDSGDGVCGSAVGCTCLQRTQYLADAVRSSTCKLLGVYRAQQVPCLYMWLLLLHVSLRPHPANTKRSSDSVAGLGTVALGMSRRYRLPTRRGRLFILLGSSILWYGADNGSLQFIHPCVFSVLLHDIHNSSCSSSADGQGLELCTTIYKYTDGPLPSQSARPIS